MRTTASKSRTKGRSKGAFFQAKGGSGFFPMQAKLSIGQPKDIYEKEADKVADQVMIKEKGEPDEEKDQIQKKPLAQTLTPLIQRQESGEEEEEAQPKIDERIQKQEEEEEEAQPKLDEKIQKQEEEEEEEEAIQTKSKGSTVASPEVMTTLKQTRGSGFPLVTGVKDQMENKIGADLGGVKVHTDSTAVQLNKQLGAKAFTIKNNIYFNQGQYKPESKEGRHLLAHELAHTVQQGAVPVKKEIPYPKTPGEDPSFNSVKSKAKKTADKQKDHQPAEEESKNAQDAALSPANERESKAQAGQVNTMDQQEAGTFDAAGFKEKLMKRIKGMKLPKNRKEAFNFKSNNNIEQVSQIATEDARAEKSKAAGNIEQATKTKPDPKSIPERIVEPLPDPDIGSQPQSLKAGQAMPKKRPVDQINTPLEDNMKSVDQQMADQEITEEQLGISNEPQFLDALDAKNKAKDNVKSAPKKFREEEKSTLNSSKQQAQVKGASSITHMHTDRALIFTQMLNQQILTTVKDTAERTRIAGEINTLYQDTKVAVEKILSDLDKQVTSKFKAAATKAKQKFENHVKSEMKDYKSRRYSGARGKLRWVRDLFKGIPDEVNQFFTEGRNLYIKEMDSALTDISSFIGSRLSDAKIRIAKGKKDVSDYVAKLPKSLQNIGKEAANSIDAKFDNLESNVDNKQDELINSLAQQYNENLAAVDARINKMKEENKGLIDKVVGAVVGVAKTIIKIKNILGGLLSGALSVIKSIVANPIGFLKNLIRGLGQGFKNFGKNIKQHLISGLVGWLTGALGPLKITIPKNLFSLKGIFSLVMQVLGLTWDYIRQKAVKLLGEPIVSALETTFEIFKIMKKEGVSGLWKFIKEKFTDLKETVIGSIKEMVISQVIEAGIKWVLGLMSPAGAFVKAAMMIIDIVKFFIERGSQIAALVKAFINGIKAVASGSVQKVAKAIENALAKALPVVIGFMASLLGLGGLASKVMNLIRKVRKRIDKTIDKVILKAQKGLGKLGNKVKGAATKLFMWWKRKKVFTAADGKKHKIYFKGSGKHAKLMVASEASELTKFIEQKDPGENATKAEKNKALNLSKEIDKLAKSSSGGKPESEKNKSADKDVKTKMDQLVPLVNKIMTGKKQSITLLNDWLNKKVTEPDMKGGDILPAFRKAVAKSRNIKKYQHYVIKPEKEDKEDTTSYKMTYGKDPDRGLMPIHIDKSGVLIPGSMGTKYTPPHSQFNPQNLRIDQTAEKYTATYQTEQLAGAGKQTYTVDISYKQLEQSQTDYTEKRVVTGEEMMKKPGGRGRGKTDSAGRGFDNAHLIGDRFGGSGYNQALNIYPSSPDYNRKTMLDKESSLYGKLDDQKPFTMTVDATIRHGFGKDVIASPKQMEQKIAKEIIADLKKKPDKAVEEGMVKKFRQEITKSLADLPGQFQKVDYEAEQKGGGKYEEHIDKDEGYETAIGERKKKTG